jgi:3(or 17)beta-hydroxysteroid dehydrogenase
MGRVENKVALITGAGMGLGRAAAFLLTSEGAKIAVTDINVAAGEATATEINDRGGEAVFPLP